MDDQRCMVCEFPNEENAISIGYLEWLEDRLSITELDEAIKRGTILKARWPKSCDVGPAAVMKKKLANCQWETVAAKILAQGGWIEMREVRDNLEKYGITKFNKQDRKQFTKKTLSDSDIDESELKNKQKNATLGKKRAAVNVNKGKELLKLYKQKQKSSSQNKLRDDSDDGYSDEHEKSPVHKQSKSQLAETVTILNEENKKLRRDIERLRKLRSVNEDLPKIEKMMKDLSVDLQAASRRAESLNHQMDDLQRKIHTMRNSDVKDAGENKITRLRKELVSDPTAQNKEIDLPNTKKSLEFHRLPASKVQNEQANPRSDTLTLSQESQAAFLTQTPSRELTPPEIENDLVLSNLNTEPMLDEFDNTTAVATDEVKALALQSADRTARLEDKHPHDESVAVQNPRAKTVDLGGPEPCAVNATRLALCNHTTASKLICELMSLLFSKEELATSSLTGTVANFHCEKGVPAKKKLDAAKIEAVKAYTKNKFPMEKDFEKIFRKAVQQKCNNACPRTRAPKKGETNK